MACFKYGREGSAEEAFCLSPYCYGCLKKDSISVQLRGFWGLSFGDVKVVSSGEIDKSVVEKFIRNNGRMAEYLYAMKNIVVQNVVVKPNLLLIKFDQTLFT